MDEIVLSSRAPLNYTENDLRKMDEEASRCVTEMTVAAVAMGFIPVVFGIAALIATLSAGVAAIASKYCKGITKDEAGHIVFQFIKESLLAMGCYLQPREQRICMEKHRWLGMGISEIEALYKVGDTKLQAEKSELDVFATYCKAGFLYNVFFGMGMGLRW